jgi:multidrug efflux system outer membrane protein
MLAVYSPPLGAEPQPLSLDAALAKAVERSLTLQRDAVDLKTAEFAAKNLWSEIFPGISIRTELGYSSPLFSGTGFSLEEQQASYSFSLGLSFSLNAGIPAAVKRIELAYRTEMLDYENAVRQIEIQITKQFYSLLAEKKNLSNLEQALDLAERQLERTEIAFKNGLTRELSVLQGRLALATARFNLSSAQAVYDSSRGEFFMLLGMEQDADVVLEEALTIRKIDADAESLIRQYLPKRPDIRSRQQSIERLELTAAQTKLSSRTPSLSLSTTYRGGSGNAGIQGPYSDGLSASIGLNIPVDSWIPGTKADQGIRSASAEIEKAKLDLKNTEDAAMNEIRSLTARLRNSWESIEIARLQEEIAGNTYRLTDEGFRNGTVDNLTLEDAQKNLAEARQKVLASELSYQNMMLDLAAALNIDWKEFLFSGNGF